MSNLRVNFDQVNAGGLSEFVNLLSQKLAECGSILALRAGRQVGRLELVESEALRGTHE